MRLAAVTPQRPFEHSRNLELRLPGPDRCQRVAQPRGRQRRCGANRCDFTRVLAHAQPLDQLTGRLPAPRRTGSVRKVLRVLHTECLRLEADQTERPERRQLLKEPVPHTRPFDLDACGGAALLPGLLVVAEIGDQEQGPPGRQGHARRPAESRQIADVRPRRHEQRVQAFRFEQCGERRMSLGALIATRGTWQALRIPADSCRRRIPSPRPLQDPPAWTAAAPARVRRYWRDALPRTARGPRATRRAPQDWYA